MKWVWEFKWGKIKSDESGYVLVMAIFVLVITSLIAVGLAVVGANEFQLSARTRLMDTTYQIAEAGITRACAYIKDNPSIVLTTGGGTHDYKQPGDTAQWITGTATGDPNTEYKEDFGVTGWKGKYKARIWQSELASDNPYYKVIVSTGYLERNGQTAERRTKAERTIEARIVAGPSTTDYDSSFDYCIYNGFYGSPEDSEEPTADGVWPGKDYKYWLGNIDIDGVTADRGHSPKGAIYTRGSIEVPSNFLSSCKIHGNIVATKDITLTCSQGVSGGGFGITIDNIDQSGKAIEGQGNVVAGLGGTGNVNLTMEHEYTGGTSGLKISPGWVVAMNNVNIKDLYTTTFGNDNATIETSGIIAGGNVTAVKNESYKASKGIVLGNIFCTGKVDLTSTFGGLTFGQVSAGATPVGVHVENLSGGVLGGAIYSKGKVEMKAASAGQTFKTGNIYAAMGGSESVNIDAASTGISVGNICARGGVTVKAGDKTSPTIGAIYGGIDNTSTPAGNGVKITATSGGNGGVISTGAITAVGSVTLDVANTGTWATTSNIGDIWSGAKADIKLSCEHWTVYLGDISARGEAVFKGTIDWWGQMEIGRVSAEGNASVTFKTNAAATYIVQGIKTGGNATYCLDGIWSTARSMQLSPWDRGPGTPHTQWIGSALNDSIDAKNNVTLQTLAGLNWLRVYDNVNAGGTVFTLPCPWSVISIFGTPPKSGVVNLKTWTPGVPVPTFHQPAPHYLPDPDPTSLTLLLPADPFEWGPSSGFPTGKDATTADWLGYKVPVVDQSLLLFMADRLDTPVQFLEPNWNYFAEAAASDEGKICPNPKCGKINPRGAQVCQFCGTDLSTVADKRAHILKDTGDEADGDWDGLSGNGRIEYHWDARVVASYSSNETIYQDDPNVDVVIDVNWKNGDSDFVGTLVTKGDVKLSDDLGQDWLLESGQELNIVSGKSIKKDTSGVALWKTSEQAYHFWARNNIDFTDMTFAIGKVDTFKGSFTAGNRLIYHIDNVTALWPINKWVWTRWSLDANAWLPAFTVLSYKEI